LVGIVNNDGKMSMKLLTNKKVRLIISFILTFIFAVLPGIGFRKEAYYYMFGFPADVLGYYGDGAFSYQVWGLLFNVLCFYFLLFLFNKFLNFVRNLFTK
jgi:hypothetical protein